MGDRTWTGITFSGTMNIEVAQGLVDELIEQGCQGGSGDVITVDDLREHTQFYDEECNYATMEGIELYCQTSGISYLKVWSPGGDYDGGYQLYNAVTGVTFEVQGRDEPAMGVAELDGFLKEGKTLQDVVAYLKAIADFDKNYPAAEIVE